jgi:hypothetical protein
VQLHVYEHLTHPKLLIFAPRYTVRILAHAYGWWCLTPEALLCGLENRVYDALERQVSWFDGIDHWPEIPLLFQDRRTGTEKLVLSRDLTKQIYADYKNQTKECGATP